jgi:hypothetical protein
LRFGKGRVSSGILAIGDFFPPVQQARFEVFLVFEEAVLPFFTGIMRFFGADFFPVPLPSLWLLIGRGDVRHRAKWGTLSEPDKH